MNISPISFINFKGTQKVNKMNVQAQRAFMSQPIKNDRFTKSEFNLESAMRSLETVKNDKNKPKFNDWYLQNIKTELQAEPKKWDAVNSLAHNKKVNGEFVYMLASQPLDKLNEIKFYSEVKDEKGENKYDGKALMNFNDKANAEDLTKVRPLTKTALSPKNIVAISQEKDLPDINKLSDKILEIQKEQGKDLEEISAVKDDYKNKEVLVVVKNGNTKITKAFDKNLNAIYDEKRVEDKENNIIKTYTKDYRNNSTSEITSTFDKDAEFEVVTSEIRTQYNKNGEIEYTEKTTPSEVQGVLNVTRTNKDGNKTILSSGKIDKKTGIASVKKEMTSLDGTKTEYLYENDPQGNRILDYKITDKKGKTLLNLSEAFEVINKNKFISSRGEERYQIDITDKGVKVQNLKDKNKKAEFRVGKELDDKPQLLINTLKQLSGDELIKMRENIDTLVGLDNCLDSNYNGGLEAIFTGDNAFLLTHEIGHTIDFKNTDISTNESYEKTFKNTITMDKAVNKVYDEEISNFLKAFPDAQRKHIDYFIRKEKHMGGEKGGVSETIAETNALINSPKTDNSLRFRTQYLQQYFPKTIAEVAKKLG